MRTLIVVLVFAGVCGAQDDASHKFWDKQNMGLFAGVTAARVLDMHSTWGFRARGVDEGNLSNGFVDDKPKFAAYSLGAVGANIGVAYLLHRTGHHRLERVISLVHVGVVVKDAVGNYRREAPVKCLCF